MYVWCDRNHKDKGGECATSRRSFRACQTCKLIQNTIGSSMEPTVHLWALYYPEAQNEIGLCPTYSTCSFRLDHLMCKIANLNMTETNPWNYMPIRSVRESFNQLKSKCQRREKVSEKLWTEKPGSESSSNVECLEGRRKPMVLLSARKQFYQGSSAMYYEEKAF